MLNLSAQRTLEEINYCLDTHPYFDLRFEYEYNHILPDSIKEKIINALKRELPKHFTDSIFSIPQVVLDNITKAAWEKCKTDTVCFEKEYKKMYTEDIRQTKNYYYNECYSRSLILACGRWGVKEAIPYLKEELQNKYCEKRHIELEMALAKLNDPIKEILVEKYTLSHILQTTELDTINDNFYDMSGQIIDFFHEGIRTAIYLRDKNILLNLVDLVYIKGKYDSNISISYIVSFITKYYSDYFHNFSNCNVLRKICIDYSSAIWHLSERKLDKKEKKELEILLSTEYRTKIRNQIRNWIIENVNFEE
jgi:hypothetical protein